MQGVLFTIFGFPIYWYSIFIVIGLLLGIKITTILIRRRGYNDEVVWDLIIAGVPLGLVGARLFFVAFNWDFYRYNIGAIFSLRMEGVAIYGAVIGGVLAAYIVSRFRKCSFFDIADCAAPSLILAQALGRWGNFFNQEVYGGVVENVSGQISSHLALFPPAVYIDAVGEWHVALFLIESVWNLIVFACLMTFFYKSKRRGCTTFLYFALYSGMRAILEGFREEEFILTMFGLPVDRILAAAVCIVAVVLFIVFFRKGGARAKPIPEIYQIQPEKEK